MRLMMSLSLVISVIAAVDAHAADRITYAIGGPAHRSVDTFANVPLGRGETGTIALQGEMAGDAAKHCAEAEAVEIRARQPFLRESASGESLFKRSEALFLHFPPREAHEPPLSIEAPPTTGSPFDGMPLAAR